MHLLLQSRLKAFCGSKPLFGAATPCMFSLSAIFWRKNCIRSGSYSVLYIVLLLGLPILHLGYTCIRSGSYSVLYIVLLLGLPILHLGYTCIRSGSYSVLYILLLLGLPILHLGYSYIVLLHYYI